MVMNMLYKSNPVMSGTLPADLSTYPPGSTAGQGGTAGHWCIELGVFANSTSPSTNGVNPAGAIQHVDSSNTGHNQDLIDGTNPNPTPIVITCSDSTMSCTADMPTTVEFPKP